MLYLCLGIKETFMLFLNVFCDFKLFLKIFSTHFTSISSNVLSSV